MKKIYRNRALVAKKKFFFLTALLCASMMGWADATPYCGVTSPNESFTFSLSHVGGTTYKIQFDAVGDIEFGGSAVNVNCGVNQTSGEGITFGNSGWVFTDKRAYKEFETASESSVPTGFYGNYFCFSKKGGDIIVIENFNPTNVDWTATCGAAVKTDPQLTINRSEITLDAEHSDTCHIVPTTKTGYDGTITYVSDHPGIASVTDAGIVTAVGRGTAIITVTAPETDSYAKATKKLTVTVTGPINWEGLDWLSGSNDKYKLVTEPEISNNFGGKKIEGSNLWIGFPSAVWGDNSDIEHTAVGAGVSFPLSQFPKEHNEFNYICDGTTYKIMLYYADGSDSTTAIDNIETNEKARKVFENGQLIIIKNGVKYNALGAELR